MTPVLNYLVTASVCGGLLGAVHGYRRAPHDIHTIAYDMSCGLFLGPYAPIMIPVYALRTHPNGKCPAAAAGGLLMR